RCTHGTLNRSSASSPPPPRIWISTQVPTVAWVKSSLIRGVVDGGATDVTTEVDGVARGGAVVAGVACVERLWLFDANQIAPASSAAHIRYPNTRPTTAASHSRSPVRRICGKARCPSPTPAGGTRIARIGESTASVL